MSNVTEILEKIESLTLLEAAELVKAMEEKFGVSAAAPVAAIPPGFRLQQQLPQQAQQQKMLRLK